MKEIVPNNMPMPLSVKESVLDVLSRQDSKTILLLGGMFCLTTMFCVGCACLSGSEMTLSKNEFSIKHPSKAS